MKKFIKSFKNKNEDQFNIKLIKREYEEDLVSFIVDIFKSLSTTGMIELIDYKVITDESKINMSKYITSRKKTKKADKHIKYHYIQFDRCDELILTFKLTVREDTDTITVSLLVPKKDSNNYYTLRSKKYFLLYQLVDNSTYTSINALTLKSLMPICIKRNIMAFEDIDGNSYSYPYYYLAIFKRDIEALLFYLCKMGFRHTLSYFTVDEIMKVITEDPKSNDDEFIYFQLNKTMWLKVSRYFFNKYLYVKSMVIMVMKVITSKTRYEDLESREFWMQTLGGLYTKSEYKKYDHGKSTIIFFERLLDQTTKRKLKISDAYKLSIYSVVKWMIQNFVELKKKNNLDLNNKRLRLNEYIGAILSKRIGDGVSRILSNGNDIQLKQVKNIFKFPGTIIFQSLHTSPLLKFDDRVNDLDVFSALRYSVKGPQSLGDRSTRNISIKYRGTHPSYIGALDLNVCSSSSPGLSGCCSPFAKTYGLYFSDKKEPETQEFELRSEIDKVNKKKYKSNINISNDCNSDVYYDRLLKLYETLREFNASMVRRVIESDEVEDLGDGDNGNGSSDGDLITTDVPDTSAMDKEIDDADKGNIRDTKDEDQLV